MKKFISVILSICIVFSCFVIVANAGTDDIEIKVIKAPKSIKIGQSIEDVGGFEVKVSNLSRYIGYYYSVGPKCDGAMRFSGEYGDAPPEIEGNTEVLNYFIGDHEPWYAPGKIVIEFLVYNSETWELVIEKALFEIIVEEPVIKTNAPEYVAVNSSLDFKTELTNIITDNVKVSYFGNKTYHSDDWGNEWYDVYASEHPLGYQPNVEIIEGKELVKQTSQDYSYMLNTSEKLMFKGMGVVKLRVKYNQLNPLDYDAYRYPTLIHDDENCICEEWYNSGNYEVPPCYEAVLYSPEKIIAIFVTETGESPVPNDSYTGLFKFDGTWFYAKNGNVDFNYTGLCKYNGKWYYVEDGVVDKSYTGLCKYNSKWYYVNKGVVDKSYTGLCKYNSKWYYVSKGVVDKSYTGLCKYNSKWYYVNKGVVDKSYTGLCKYNSKWYYVNKGVVDKSYTGLCKYNSKWYYVNKGKVDFTYTGNVKYNGKTYKVVKGVKV